MAITSPTTHVVAALEEGGGFMSRYRLEREAKRRGVQPRTFTRVTHHLVESGVVRLVAIEIEGYPRGIAFASRPVADAERAEAAELYMRRIDARNPQVLKNAGEAYVRAIFAKAKALGAEHILRVPRSKIGATRLAGSLERADLIVQARLASACTAILVEVKNAQEEFHLTRPLFAKLMRQAFRSGFQPMLVCAHIDDRAMMFCQTVGIVVLVLGRQIVTTRQYKVLRELYGREHAATMFQSFNMDRPYRGRCELGPSAPHVRFLSDMLVFEDAHAIWRRTTARGDDVANALERGDWATVEAIERDLRIANSRLSRLHPLIPITKPTIPPHEAANEALHYSNEMAAI